MISHSLKAKERMYSAVRQYQFVLIVMSDSRCLYILEPDEKWMTIGQAACVIVYPACVIVYPIPLEESRSNRIVVV